MAKYSPEILAAMSARITDNAKKWWALARATFGDGIGTMPELKMNSRLTSTAGRAFIMDDPAYCYFSVYLFEKYPEEFFNDTVPHELAHHIPLFR